MFVPQPKTPWEAFKRWLNPTWKPIDVSVYYNVAEPEPEPTPKTPRVAPDAHTMPVGVNSSGNVVKSTPLSFESDHATSFSTIREYSKNKPTEANVVAHVTNLDNEELARRKPRVSEAAAVIIKAAYAERKGATTATELANLSGYSVPYCEAAIASFRAALLRERG